MSKERFTPDQQRYLSTLTPHERGVVEFRHFCLATLWQAEAASPESLRCDVFRRVVAAFKSRYPRRAPAIKTLADWETRFKRAGLPGLSDGRGRALAGERFRRANPRAITAPELAEALVRLRDGIVALIDAEITALRARRPQSGRGAP